MAGPATLARIGIGRLGLGTWLFGWDTPEAEARRLFDRALSHGIRYVDTANNYGAGAAERIIGRAIRPYRDQIVLGTKVYAQFGPHPADRGLSASAVTMAVEASLRRLGTDRVEILYLHRPDPATPPEETAQALAALVTSGKVRAIGTSTFRADQIDAMQHALQAAGAPLAVCDQAPYSLLERSVEALAEHSLQAWGMGVVAWSPLGEGLLTGKYGAAPGPSGPDGRGIVGGPGGRLRRWDLLCQPRFRAGVERAAAFARLAADCGLTPTELALGWLARRRLVGCVLIGARTASQLDGYLQGIDAVLPPGIQERIDAIVGPGETVLHHYQT